MLYWVAHNDQGIVVKSVLLTTGQITFYGTDKKGKIIFSFTMYDDQKHCKVSSKKTKTFRDRKNTLGQVIDQAPMLTESISEDDEHDFSRSKISHSVIESTLD